MGNEAIALFQGFMGTGLIMIWYLLSAAYLWMKEERGHIRILFLYTPAVLLLFYFNPVFGALMRSALGGEIYYRILWLLPISISIAYASVHIYGQLRLGGRRRADLAALCMAGILMASGSFIYSSPYFFRAENPYHMPDSIVRICDAILVPGREVMAVFPLELVQYVRQYSAFVCMPYGREMEIARWNFNHPLCDAMEQEVIDMDRLVPLAREYRCHYVIFRGGQRLKGEPGDYGWTLFGEIGGYTVYRDPAVELVIP